jgi:hypothetical protein
MHRNTTNKAKRRGTTYTSRLQFRQRHQKPRPASSRDRPKRFSRQRRQNTTTDRHTEQSTYHELSPQRMQTATQAMQSREQHAFRCWAGSVFDNALECIDNLWFSSFFYPRNWTTLPVTSLVQLYPNMWHSLSSVSSAASANDNRVLSLPETN